MNQLIFLLVLILPLFYTQGFTEWQSGIDIAFNEQAAYKERSNYPVTLQRQQYFPRKFSRVPQVLLMFEELSWTKNKDLEFQVSVSDISIRGFNLNYYFAGPALTSKTRVRWVAILDYGVEVKYVSYDFNDLIRLRQGQGRRQSDFEVFYDKTHYPTPRVTAFIVGAKFVLDESETYDLEVRVGRPLVRSVPLEFKTRSSCHINKVMVALLIASNSDVITTSGGAVANEFNKFDDRSNPVTRRDQRFEMNVPYSFMLETHKNILAQGISGFDVNSKAGDIYLKVGNQYVMDQTYHMTYGTCIIFIKYNQIAGQTILNSMWFSIVLHKPALPDALLLQENENDQEGN